MTETKPPATRATTIAGYIRAAPAVARPHLRAMHALLKEVAPHATETIKWGTPFFVEPRFLFGFSAHKAHLGFAPPPATMQQFATELKQHATTKYTLKVPYDQPLPEDLIRRMARHSLKLASERGDDRFW